MPKLLRLLNLSVMAGCAGLAGCGDLHLTQPDKQALVRTEGHIDHHPDGPIAARLLPYSLLAESAYDGKLTPGARPAPFQIDCTKAPAAACNNKNAFEARANTLLRQYRAVRSFEGPLECLDRNQAACVTRVNGLGVHLWRRPAVGSRCQEAVIVFRGTDPDSLGDWLSNFHWITRILPLHDQYEQVQEHLKVMLKHLDQCRREGGQIVAVGHSLGGGLAQHAAYIDRRIRHVYGFNPSMVTGYFDRHLTERSRNEQGLRIERAYEHGEILAYPRYVARRFVPVTNCNPRIVNIRFNRTHGNIIFQHSMHQTNIGLLTAAAGAVPEKAPLAAQPCGNERAPAPRRERPAIVARQG